MKSILETAEIAEQRIHELLKGKFDLPEAYVYSIKTNPSDELEVVKRHANSDVYDLLSDEYTLSVTKSSEYIAVLTSGWASPLSSSDDDNDVAPSQHPLRRRVRLVVVASRQGVASVIRFSDTPDETVTDNGKAKGSLADAIYELFDKSGALNN